MNRRPNQSRSGYDSFSAQHAARMRIQPLNEDFFSRRRKKPLWQILLLACVCAAALFFIGNFAVNQMISVKRVTVPIRGLNEAFDGYTILQLSDLKGARFGGEQGMLDFALSSEKFDLVVMTGDMISPLGNAQPFYALLDRIKALGGGTPVYYVVGDSDPLAVSMDYAAGGSPFAPWVLGASQRGAQLLSGPVAIEREGQRIWLATSAQLSLDMDTMQGQYEAQYLSALASGDENEIELTEYNLKSLEGIRSARAQMNAQDVYIALTHVLPAADDPGALTPAGISRPIDLMLGGHYLGGLIRLPVAGALFIPSKTLPNYGLLPGDDAYSGLTRRGTTWLYASSGLGSKDSMYPQWFFRLLNPPSVTLITLTPSAL